MSNRNVEPVLPAEPSMSFMNPPTFSNRGEYLGNNSQSNMPQASEGRGSLSPVADNQADGNGLNRGAEVIRPTTPRMGGDNVNQAVVEEIHEDDLVIEVNQNKPGTLPPMREMANNNTVEDSIHQPPRQRKIVCICLFSSL